MKKPKVNLIIRTIKKCHLFYIFIIQANKHRLNLDPGLMTYVFDSPVSIAMIGT